MQAGARRRARNSAAAAAVGGSVWETRMRMDEVKGGIKVFSAEKEAANADEAEGIRVFRRLRSRNQSDGGGVAGNVVERKKRRNWKPPEPVSDNKNPIQPRKARSELLSRQDEDEDEIEIEIEGEIKNFDDKEIDLPPPTTTTTTTTTTKAKIVEVEEDEEKKIQQICEIPVSSPPEIDPATDLKKIERMESDPVKPHAIEIEEEVFEIGSEATNRMQNIVDLVMWRDISKSAFVFGFGTFILLSSSYTKDLDFSLLSAISYLGLVYLALIFLYKSILRREGVEFEEREGERCIIGDEEAIWALRFILPYINEVLIKIKALFSGDPATTMKLAVLLFVMARCGSSITVWTLAKLVFFGVFTLPKVLSCYSVQLAKYGKFWVERFTDGWESCTHKKAFAAAIFTLIWNISSTVARIWAVFMLVVAVKFYQQRAVEWNVVDDEDDQQQHTEEERKGRQEDSKAAAVQSPGKSLQNRQLRNGPKREIKAKKWT